MPSQAYGCCREVCVYIQTLTDLLPKCDVSGFSQVRSEGKKTLGVLKRRKSALCNRHMAIFAKKSLLAGSREPELYSVRHVRIPLFF